MNYTMKVRWFSLNPAAAAKDLPYLYILTVCGRSWVGHYEELSCWC